MGREAQGGLGAGDVLRDGDSREMAARQMPLGPTLSALILQREGYLWNRVPG